MVRGLKSRSFLAENNPPPAHNKLYGKGHGTHAYASSTQPQETAGSSTPRKSDPLPPSIYFSLTAKFCIYLLTNMESETLGAPFADTDLSFIDSKCHVPATSSSG